MFCGYEMAKDSISVLRDLQLIKGKSACMVKHGKQGKDGYISIVLKLLSNPPSKVMKAKLLNQNHKQGVRF